jgi:signal transduction histidine kinase
MTTTWSSRAEWANERRTPYYDRFPSTSNSLAKYATPEEIAVLKAALRKRWRNLGKKMRKLRGNAARDVISDLKSHRSSLQWALALIAQGELPRHLETFGEAEDILAPFHERYEAAKSKLHECTLKEIERTPIDDNAWNDELHRRAMADQWRSVSTLKQRQAKLEQARSRAEAIDRSKSQFLTNVSHEIQTLNGIMGFNHRPNLTKRQRDYSKLIHASAYSLQSLFDEVVDLGNIEIGLREIEALPVKTRRRRRKPCACYASRVRARKRRLHLYGSRS